MTRDDPRALELIRHDAAHVMAEAVQELWPGTQVTIGPVIENGFYYDFYRETPFTPEDFPKIEAKMREIIARDAPFTKEVWKREDVRALFSDKQEKFKVELVDAIPPGALTDALRNLIGWDGVQQIDRLELTRVLVVVSRIFGGTKLGTGGLVSAYTESVADTLEHVTRVIAERVNDPAGEKPVRD